MHAQEGIRHGDRHFNIDQQFIAVGDAHGGSVDQPRFGHMFERLKLPAFEAPPAQFDGPEPLEALAAYMAWEDQLEDPSADSGIPAGYTVLGQFITHDLTFNNRSLDGVPDGRGPVRNYRSPAFDLDSVYGPSPQLFITPPSDPLTGKMNFRASPDGLQPDDLLRFMDEEQPGGLLRFADEQALIGDVRNDENVLISQLHLAFLKLHNQFVDDIDQGRIRADAVPGETNFDKARYLCQWHYQWVVVNDYLPRIVGQEMVDDILQVKGGEGATFGLKLYTPAYITPPTIPYEFSAAAFRFGHTMIRSHYHINDGGPLPLFGYSSGDSRHLGGRRRLDASLVVDWSRLFTDLPRPITLASDLKFTRNFARKIDSHLTKVLRTLPDSTLPPGPDFHIKSLAIRDLQRGVELGLPSGQAVANAMGVKPLETAQLGLEDLRWEGDVPLWFYILKEAEVTAAVREVEVEKEVDGEMKVQVEKVTVTGEQLGPVGGRIVAEVILGLLQCDEDSYLNTMPEFDPTDPPWRVYDEAEGSEPTNPYRPVNGEKFTMADLLRRAGVSA